MYPIYTCIPDGGTVGESGLCCYVLCSGLPLLFGSVLLYFSFSSLCENRCHCKRKYIIYKSSLRERERERCVQLCFSAAATFLCSTISCTVLHCPDCQMLFYAIRFCWNFKIWRFYTSMETALPTSRRWTSWHSWYPFANSRCMAMTLRKRRWD